MVAAASVLATGICVSFAVGVVEVRIGVVAEIVLFAMQSRLPPVFEPTVLLMVGACGGMLRWAGMAFDPPLSLLTALQLLHALSFGATHLGALMFLARYAPASQAADRPAAAPTRSNP